MKMKLVGMLVMVAMMAVACGDSGDSGMPLVLLTEDNAVEMSQDAYFGGYGDAEELSGLKNGAVDKRFLDTMEMLGVSTVEAIVGTGTKESYTETVYGSCTGSEVVTITSNGSNAMTIRMSMTNFNDDGGDCSNGTTMDGVMTISAYYTIISDEEIDINRMVMRFSAVHVSEPGLNGTINGTIDFRYVSSSQMQITVNMTQEEDASGVLISYINYTGTLTETSSGMEETLSGRYENSAYGAVMVSTTQTVVTQNVDNYPSSGTVLITGANGESGPSAAMLMFLANDQYTVQCDADGDGTYEWSSGTLTW